MKTSLSNKDEDRRSEDATRPRVSVIVPIYNVERYLADCLDSLLLQTLRNIEIIAVDDGSTDGSSEILQGYADLHPNRIRAYGKPNGGLSDARNYGVERARGEYIGFVDSDDWAAPEMFLSMYEQAVETDSEAVVCGARLHFYEDDEEVVESARDINLRGKITNFGSSVEKNPHILFSSHSYACTKLFHRRLFDEGKFEFPVGQWYEDSAVIYNILYAANRVACLEQNFYHYRFNRSGAITNSLSPRIFDIFKSCDSLLGFYKDKRVGHPEIDVVLEKLVRTHIFGRYRLFLENTDKGYSQPDLTWEEKKISWAFVVRAFEYLDTEFPGWKKRYKYGARAQAPVWWRARKNRVLMFVLIFMPAPGLKVIRRLNRARWDMRGKRHQIVDSVKGVKALPSGVEQEQVLVKQRADLKRFGFDVLSQLDQVFERSGVTYFADFGTLLGFVREGGFMEHDLDLDLGVFADDEQKLDIYASLLDAGFEHFRTYRFEGNIVEYSFFSVDEYGRTRLKFDINFYENDDDRSRCLLFFYRADAGLPPRHRFAVEMNYSSIDTVVPFDVQGHQVPVPANYELLLSEKYGPSWGTPDPSWVYWESPAATHLEPLGHYVTKYQMPEDKLRQLQVEQLTVLDAFESVCKQHGFRYYLAEGTLLGAVRHQGYIPWDDDIDVSMPRSDYDQLLTLPAESWPSGFGLWNQLTDPNYHLPFSKVVARAHNGFRNTFPVELAPEFSGPRMDIFPLDRVTQKQSAEKYAVAEQLRLLRDVMLVKVGYPGKKRTKAMPANLELIPMTVFQDWIATLASKDNDDPDARFIVNWASAYDHLKQTFPADYYGEAAMLMFAGKARPCPREYDKILTTIYGDYMTPPPEDQRQNASHYMIWDRWA